MTEPGFQRLMRTIGAVWQHLTLDADTIAAWRKGVAGLDDSRAMDAIDQLANERVYAVTIADVRNRCVALNRHPPAAELIADRQRQLQPTTDTARFEDLPADEQDHWIDKALGEWPPLPSITRDSTVIRSHAAHLARRTT